MQTDLDKMNIVNRELIKLCYKIPAVLECIQI